MDLLPAILLAIPIASILIAVRILIVLQNRKEQTKAIRTQSEYMKRYSQIPQSDLAAFCKRWDVVRFSIFGSFLREDYNPNSDVDVLVEFAKHTKHTLLDLVRMQHELQNIFHRDVDLLTKQGVQSSRNTRRRDEILSTAEVIYAA